MRARYALLAVLLTFFVLPPPQARADVSLGGIERKGSHSPEFLAQFVTCDSNEQGHGACIRHNYNWFMSDDVEVQKWCTGSCFQQGAKFYWRLSTDHLFLDVRYGNDGPFDVR